MEVMSIRRDAWIVIPGRLTASGRDTVSKDSSHASIVSKELRILMDLTWNRSILSLRMMWKTGRMWRVGERVMRKMRKMRKRGIRQRIECLGLKPRGLGRGREV